MNKQPLKREKTISSIISVITALGILVGGTLIAVKPKVKKPVTPDTTTGQTEQNVDGLVLTEDFDINNKDEVRKRAQAIYGLSEGSLSVENIMDLIYYFNGKYESLSFASLNDKEKKFAELQKLALMLEDLLNDNIHDDINKLSAIGTDEEKDIILGENNLVYSYMLMPKQNAAKDLAIDYATVVNKQIEDIKLGSEENFKTNAEAFESLVKTLRETKDLKDGEYVLLFVDEQTKTALFGNLLSKDTQDLIYLNEHNTYLNSIGFEASKEIGAYKEATNMEQVTTTPTTERYNQSDKKDAEDKISNSKEETTTKVVNNGGNKVPNSPGKTEVVSEATTKVEEHTFVVTVPTTETTTKFVPGGEVITEIYEDVKDTDKYIDADSTTFVVDAGGQPVKSK